MGLVVLDKLLADIRRIAHDGVEAAVQFAALPLGPDAGKCDLPFLDLLGAGKLTGAVEDAGKTRRLLAGAVAQFVRYILGMRMSVARVGRA
jgi:hypothetical protein